MLTRYAHFESPTKQTIRLWLSLSALTFSISLNGCSSEESPPAPVQTPQTNAAPQFSSPSSATAPERSTQSFYTATATDSNGDTVTFSIIGGNDAALFQINADTGAVSFIDAPDFENPTDSDTDNIYTLTLSASDGNASTTLSLSVTVEDVTNVDIEVERVALGLTQPVFATHAGDSTNRMFIVQQTGQIRILNLTDGSLLADPFLDVSGAVAGGNEQGLLGLAFAPDFITSGLFYVYLINLSGDTEVREYSVDPNNANQALSGSARLILTFPQPFSNHNAGWIGFDQQGRLLIASGDGGSAGDPQNNAQNINNLLGAILRIDPTSDDFPADPNANYAIPPENPFVNIAGRDEILAYGLRNPFRASIDRATGDLYIGDVGQSEIEEIDLIPAGTMGQNFGWNLLEGTRDFNGTNAPSLTPPIAEYPHNTSPTGGFSVTGGYVHRGSVEALIGRYVFADFVTGNIWSVAVAGVQQGQTIPAAEFRIETENLNRPDFGMIANISSFAEDEEGELYIIEFTRGEMFRVENVDDD